MKKLITILILFTLTNEIFAQENTNWVDSILNKVLLNQIAVYDEEFRLIKNSDIEIIKLDTVVNCQWTRPKFVNNILQLSFDGGLIENQISFDTSTNRIDSNFIDFKIHQFDENGNYLKDTVIFLISKVKSSNNDVRKGLELVNTLKNSKWLIGRIEFERKEIELDSCHNIFRLLLNEDFIFYQYYGNNQYSCSTQEMKEEMEVGVEGDSEEFFKYHNKIQGHYISLQQGNWQIEKNKLQLVDLYRKKVLTFEIEKLNNKELHLILKGKNYKIIMKKASH